MKIAPTFFLFIVFVLTLIYSQAQINNIWTFGVNARLDFVNGLNPPNVGSSAISSYEGSASISDNLGNLLFYTDGITVYNNSNTVIQTGLMGHWSSAQCGIIVPEPGVSVNTFSNRYYIFSIPELASERARYTIVDVNSGNPVISPANVNLTLPDHNTAQFTTESITVARHCNGIDFWIITHEIGNNKFKAYQLTNAGLLSPVISSIGPNVSTISGNINAACHMKISPNNKKLAFCVRKSNVNLFDFNPSNGQITNHTTVTSGPNQNYYGVEFSPNSSILYYTDILTNLYKHEILSGSNVVLGNIPGPSGNNLYGALQLAPNGNIYMARDGVTNMSVLNQPFLGLISNPNSFSGSTFSANGLPLFSGTASKAGLPNLIPSINTSSFSISNDTTICIGESATLTSAGGISYSWSPSLGLNTTNSQTVIASPNTTQTYVVSITDVFGCIGLKSVNVFLDTSCCTQVFNTSESISVCENENYTFPDGSNQLIVSSISHQSFLINQNGCDSVVTTYITPISISETHDTIKVCLNEIVTFPDGSNQSITNNVSQISTLQSITGCDSIIYTFVDLFENYEIIIYDTICFGTNYTFPDGTSHFDIIENEIYTINNSTVNGCDSISIFHLIIIKKPDATILGEESICENESRVLTSNESNPNYIYYWNTGNIGPFISILTPGTYILNIENTCGIDTDSIEVMSKNCLCNLFIPNTFTPDDNEFNQTFKVKYDCEIESFELLIFNRWGEIIFQNYNIDIPWDGTYQGEISPDGIYAYNIFYKSKLGVTNSIIGHVNLIR
jgi:gliding motility-associated-like protein